jgi:hypothetical protein
MGVNLNNHLRLLDSVERMVTNLRDQGHSETDINQVVLTRCLISMDGVLASIADSLLRGETGERNIESYDLFTYDEGTYFRFNFDNRTWDYSDFMLPRVYIERDEQGYSPEEGEIEYLFITHNPKTVDEFKKVLVEGGFNIESFDYEKEIKEDGKVQ